MKIEFDREEFGKALGRIGSVVEKKSTMPILGNLVLEASGETLSIYATDLEIGIRSDCPVRVVKEGKACVPARSLLDIARELPERTGKLQKGENEWMMLESGKARFRMVGVNAEEFPQMLRPNNFSFATLRVEPVRAAIEKTAYAISTDEMRYNLNGAYLESAKNEKGARILRMVATDGHRLALNSWDLATNEQVTLKKGIILPRKGINELRRLLAETAETEIGVAFNDANAAFQLPGVMMYMRLIVGEFPDYRAVVPKGHKRTLMFDRSAFTHALKRVALLAEGKSKCIRLSLKKTGTQMAANSPELGEADEDLVAEYDGADVQVGFNARYLLDALTGLEGAKTVLELDNEQSPGLLRTPDDPNTVSVIMPMRI